MSFSSHVCVSATFQSCILTPSAVAACFGPLCSVVLSNTKQCLWISLAPQLRTFGRHCPCCQHKSHLFYIITLCDLLAKAAVHRSSAERFKVRNVNACSAYSRSTFSHYGAWPDHRARSRRRRRSHRGSPPHIPEAGNTNRRPSLIDAEARAMRRVYAMCLHECVYARAWGISVGHRDFMSVVALAFM